MSVQTYPDFFNDVFGPVMQPGSSSHTAAPCRLGYMAHSLLGAQPARIRVLLDREGSFSGTFGLMAEDSAMVAGAMGILPDDVRLFDAQALAHQDDIDVAFEFTQLTESRHANAIKFVLTARDGFQISLVGDSTGGGMVQTHSVNGYPLQSRGDTYVLLVFDALAGEQLQRVEQELSLAVESGLSQRQDGAGLTYFKTADRPDLVAIRQTLTGHRVALMEPVLPVLTQPGRKPQLFDTMVQWRELARQRELPLWEVALQYEMDASGWEKDAVIAYMRFLERAMYRQTHAVYEETLDRATSPFKPDMAGDWMNHMNAPRRLSGQLTTDTLKWAYGAGAGIPGVPTVAGPMGSGGGYVHAALWAVKEAHGFDDNDLLRGLFVAAGVGAIAFSRTEPTGEVIGCTGECGVCGAMAAAAIVEMAGGSPEQVENAASLHLQAFIGLPCDPIPGGMGQPCRSRIIAAITTAHIFGDLALAGRDAVLALHEVIDVADQVGRGLPPELLCTSKGGVCITPSALIRADQFRDWFEGTRAQSVVRPPGNLI